MKLGFLVSNLAVSQINFRLITQSNLLVGSGVENDVVVFYDAIQKPCVVPNFAVMHQAEAWTFDGVLVATDFNSARKLIKFPSASRKLFYVDDLYWLRTEGFSFSSIREVFGSEELELIARCEDHQKLLSQSFNREVFVVEDYDLQEIINHVEKV